MNAGKTYIFKHFHSSCNSLYRKKLLSMGFTPGTTFTVQCVAPLGDPLILRIKGSSIAVRKAELACFAKEELL